jgi:hypothetical protein
MEYDRAEGMMEESVLTQDGIGRISETAATPQDAIATTVCE